MTNNNDYFCFVIYFFLVVSYKFASYYPGKKNTKCVCFVLDRWNYQSGLCPPCNNNTKGRIKKSGGGGGQARTVSGA